MTVIKAIQILKVNHTITKFTGLSKKQNTHKAHKRATLNEKRNKVVLD